MAWGRGLPIVRRLYGLQQQLNNVSRRFLHNFDKTTRLEASGNGASAEYAGVVTSLFSVGDAPNGGYLSVLALRAAAMSLGEGGKAAYPNPLYLSTSFYNKADENTPVSLKVTPLNKAKSSASMLVTLTQNDQIKCSVNCSFGNLTKMKGPNNEHEDARLVLPPIEECISASAVLRPALGKGHVPLTNEITFLVPKDDPFATTTLRRISQQGGFASGTADLNTIGKQASMRGYVQFAQHRPFTSETLAFICDALLPPILNTTFSPWVPTLEYNVLLLDEPEKDKEHQWLRFSFCTPYMKNGLLHTDGELWTQDGSRLLAKSRQLARLIVPR